MISIWQRQAFFVIHSYKEMFSCIGDNQPNHYQEVEGEVEEEVAPPARQSRKKHHCVRLTVVSSVHTPQIG